MIVEREREIKAFVPVEYQQISSKLKALGGELIAELSEVGGKKVEVEPGKKKESIQINSKEIADPIIADLNVAKYQVLTVEKKEHTKKANPPFTTSTLQQAAANVLGWSGKQTMMIAQQLYEAGLITYHRTDSFNLANEAITSGRVEIEKRYGKEYLPEKPNFYQTKSKNAQEAHEAIRPTDSTKYGVHSTGSMEEERQDKLYMLIWRRFMACQMKPAIYDQTWIS